MLTAIYCRTVVSAYIHYLIQSSPLFEMGTIIISVFRNRNGSMDKLRKLPKFKQLSKSQFPGLLHPSHSCEKPCCLARNHLSQFGGFVGFLSFSFFSKVGSTLSLLTTWKALVPKTLELLSIQAWVFLLTIPDFSIKT